jgi:hypothetical protein
MRQRSFQTVRLGPGTHDSPDGGEVCVMELSSMLAGGRFTDHPSCVSPVIAAFLRGYNDGLDDERRQTLRPLAAACVGTGGGDRRVERARRRLIAAHLGGRVARTAASVWLLRGATVDECGTQRVGRQVAVRGDAGRHARVLDLIDAMIALGTPSAVPARPPGEAPAPRRARALRAGALEGAP